MKLSDVRLVKSLLFGIFAAVCNNALVALLLTACALCYAIACAFTKEPANDR